MKKWWAFGLFAAAFAIMAIGIAVTSAPTQTPRQTPTQAPTQTPTQADSATPSSQYIVTENHFACFEQKDLDRVYKFIAEKDSDAANKYIATYCMVLMEGETVFLEDTAVLHGVVCVRLRGQVRCLWVDQSSVKPADQCDLLAAKVADKGGMVTLIRMGNLISMNKRDGDFDARLICDGQLWNLHPEHPLGITFAALSPAHPRDDWFQFVAKAASALTDDSAKTVYDAAKNCYQRAGHTADGNVDLSGGVPAVVCDFDRPNLEIFIAKH